MMPAVDPWIWLLVLGLNLVAFTAFGWDKLCARRRWRRVPEGTLLGLAFATGWIGAWLAMAMFRHKTAKASFRLRLALLTVVNPFWLLAYLALRA